MNRCSRVGRKLELSDSQILMSALQRSEPVRMMCRGASLDTLLAERAVHRPDLVLAGISVERRVLHPVVGIVLETARESLSADE